MSAFEEEELAKQAAHFDKIRRKNLVGFLVVMVVKIKIIQKMFYKD